MEIRKFRESDAEEVCELIKRNDLEITSKYYSKEVIDLWVGGISVEKIIKKSLGRACFVAEVLGVAVGYISLQDNEIKKLFVNPDFHKRGIGRKLIERVEKNFEGEKIFVKSNSYAEKFYEIAGFVKVKDINESVDGEEFKLILMEKRLR
jgi:GNAT superfamily N-acetyltransferase